MDFSNREVKRAQVNLIDGKLKDYGVNGEQFYIECQKKLISELQIEDGGKKFSFEKIDGKNLEKNKLLAMYLCLRFKLAGFEVEYEETKTEYIATVKWFEWQ